MTEYEDTIFQIKTIIDCWDNSISFNYDVDKDTQYFIGADFAISRGIKADYDAFVVVGKKNEIVTIKRIEIFHGITRPMKVRRLVELYNHYKSNFNTRIIADESNMGTMVIDDLRSQGLTVVPQKFTPSERNKLLTSFNNILESRILVIPHNSDDQQTIKMSNLMLEQLIGFKRKKSDKGNEIIVSTAAHDDVAISTAMVVTEATKIKKLTLFGVSGN